VRAALAVAATALAVTAAGCGGGTPKTTTAATATSGGVKPCILSPKQRAHAAAARHEIARMHRLEAPLTTWKQTGPVALELAVERFLLDVGGLPVDLRGSLIHEAKSAVGLCGDCFQALEAEEPVMSNRLGRSRCG
jgi:hypothetical protein